MRWLSGCAILWIETEGQKIDEKAFNAFIRWIVAVFMSLSINCVPCAQRLTACFALFSLQYDCIIESIYDDEHHFRFPGHELIKMKALKFVGTHKKNTHTMRSCDLWLWGLHCRRRLTTNIFRIKMKRRKKKLLTLIHSGMISTGKTSNQKLHISKKKSSSFAYSWRSISVF